MADYIFFNNNPEKLVENDCVTRAISLASGLPYEEIEDKLYLTSKLFECPKLCICCYENLLNYVFNYENIYGVEGMTIDDFANKFPYGVYLVRVEGHLSVVYEGKIMDIFDCRDMIITDCWRAK